MSVTKLLGSFWNIILLLGCMVSQSQRSVELVAVVNLGVLSYALILHWRQTKDFYELNETECKPNE